MRVSLEPFEQDILKGEGLFYENISGSDGMYHRKSADAFY
jgi:hypothetical protein